MTAFNECAPKCAFYRLSSYYWFNATSSSFIIFWFGFCFKAIHNYGLFFFIKWIELTEISWYEWFIMAIKRFNRTTILITEYVPNINMPQKRVKILIPSNSKLSKSTKPKTAQKRVCVVSNKLQGDKWENNAIKKFSNGSIRSFLLFFFFLLKFHHCKVFVMDFIPKKKL